MNAIIKTFNGQSIGIIEQDGETWIAAKDIAKALKYTNASKVIQCISPANINRASYIIMINQAGVRELAYKGRKPKRQPFYRWTLTEVFNKAQPIAAPVCNPSVVPSACPLGAIIQLLQQMQRDGCTCSCSGGSH